LLVSANPAALNDVLQSCDAALQKLSTSNPASVKNDPQGAVPLSFIALLRLRSATHVSGDWSLSSRGVVHSLPASLPVPETHPLRRIGSYGIVKATAAHIARAVGQGLIAAVVRLGERLQGAADVRSLSPLPPLRLRDGITADIGGSVVRE
jgi:hypothetical protein